MTRSTGVASFRWACTRCAPTAWQRCCLHPSSCRFPRCSCLSRSPPGRPRSEEHTSELQSLMRISYAVFCLKKKHKATILIDDEALRTSLITHSYIINNQTLITSLYI